MPRWPFAAALALALALPGPARAQSRFQEVDLGIWAATRDGSGSAFWPSQLHLVNRGDSPWTTRAIAGAVLTDVAGQRAGLDNRPRLGRRRLRSTAECGST